MNTETAENPYGETASDYNPCGPIEPVEFKPEPDLDQIIPLMTALYRKCQEKIGGQYFYLSCYEGGSCLKEPNPIFRVSIGIGSDMIDEDCRSVARVIAFIESATPEKTTRLKAEKLRAEIAAKNAELAALEGGK